MNYEIICAVCETENLSKAGQHLNYSQSAVSQAIKNYEEMLGITLFERSKTGVKSLPGVAPIIESLKTIAEEERKIRIFAESIRELDQGMIRMGCISRIATKWLPDIFKEFGEQFPNIRYEMIAGSFYDLQNALKNKTIDFAFISSMAARDFVFTPIIKDEMVVLLPKGHPLAMQKSIDIQDLKEENIIITSEGLDFEIGDILKALKIRKNDARYVFNDDIVIMKYVELGFGVCILPRLFLDIIGANFQFEIRPFHKKYYRILGIAYPNKEHMTLVSAKFIDYVLKWFKQREKNIENIML